MSWISAAWGWYAANSDKVNPIAAGIGGVALVWAAIRQARTATNRHTEQTRADQQRRLTESFSKAVEQLASDKIEARLGGIYTLDRVALEALAQARSPPWWRRLRRNRQSPVDLSDLYWPVMETLTAFVRERTRWQESKASTGGMAGKSNYLWGPDTRSDAAQFRPAPDIPTDIAAVLNVIRYVGREREKQKLPRWPLDLTKTDLRGVDLRVAPLEGATLRGAHLEGADLRGAHLEGADLRMAHLEGADLGMAHLEGADLRGAHLRGVYLGETVGDRKTRLPAGLERPIHWPPYEP